MAALRLNLGRRGRLRSFLEAELAGDYGGRACAMPDELSPRGEAGPVTHSDVTLYGFICVGPMPSNLSIVQESGMIPSSAA